MAVPRNIPSAREILNRRTAAVDSLRFPSNIDTNPHRTVMVFNKYSIPRASRPQAGIAGFLGLGDTAASFTATAGISLPVPIKVYEPYSVAYSMNDLGLIGAGLVNLIEGSSSSDLGSVLIGGAAVMAGAASSVVAGALRGGAGNIFTNALSNASGQVAAGIKASAGVALNPYTTALFKSVNLRQYDLLYKLSPQTRQETGELEKIIDAIRVRMHPEPTLSFTNLLLNFPEVLTFKVLNSTGSDGRPDYSFPTGPCFVTALTVDRTGADYPTYYAETGAPVVYFMQISLIELLPLLRQGNELTLNNPLDLIS